MAKDRPAPELAEKLDEIIKAEGGLNLVAERADISASSLSRAASGQQGVGKVTAARLEEAYGRRYGFTARQLRVWSLGAEPEEDAAPADPVPAARRVFWSRVQDEFTPEERAKAEGMIDLAEKITEAYIARERNDRVPRPRYEPPADLA